MITVKAAREAKGVPIVESGSRYDRGKIILIKRFDFKIDKGDFSQ